MAKYIQSEIIAFRESFRIRNFWKIYCLEIIKILLLITILLVSYMIFVKTFTNMQPMFNMIDEVRASGQGYTADFAQKLIASNSIFNTFIINSLAIVIVTFLVMVLVAAAIDCISVLLQKNHSIESKMILKNIYSYLTITVPLFIILGIILYFVKDQNLMQVLSMLLIAIIAYFILIFQVSLLDVGYLKNLKKGLKNVIMIHRNIIPVIIMIIAAIIFMIIISLSAIVAVWFFAVVMVLLFSLLFAWSRNYIHRLFAAFKME